nr:hypothetical protein [Candidatus Sigynarchaeota archaeon]
MSSTIDAFMAQAKAAGERRVASIHELGKRIWKDEAFTPESLQAKCMAEWDRIAGNIGSRIVPLVPVPHDRPVTNVIFGSGGFSTGSFQATQYLKVNSYAKKAPVLLQGIVANKSMEHGCNAAAVSKEYGVPLIEIDFTDWYHNRINKQEMNPVAASRYWFMRGDPARPPASEIARRFSIRQEQFHGELGELLARVVSTPIDIVSARGYNFQFCSSIFKHQARKPHVNDTHPADLTFVDGETGAKLYPGWQSGAVQLMIDHRHAQFRGSLIEVGFMDRVEQIDDLDEGALLAIGGGVSPGNLPCTADQVQAAMKVVDDHVFCTLEPTGLILAWGITEKPVKIAYQALNGAQVKVEQRAIVVGNEIRAGVNAWGKDLDKDLAGLESFLLGRGKKAKRT